MSETRRRVDAALCSTAPFGAALVSTALSTRIPGITLVSSEMQVADERNALPR